MVNFTPRVTATASPSDLAAQASELLLVLAVYPVVLALAETDTALGKRAPFASGGRAYPRQRDESPPTLTPSASARQSHEVGQQ